MNPPKSPRMPPIAARTARIVIPVGRAPAALPDVEAGVSEDAVHALAAGAAAAGGTGGAAEIPGAGAGACAPTGGGGATVVGSVEPPIDESGGLGSAPFGSVIRTVPPSQRPSAGTAPDHGRPHPSDGSAAGKPSTDVFRRLSAPARTPAGP